MPNVLHYNPADTGSYSADWSDALADGVTISGVAHSVTGLTIEAESYDDTSTIVQLSGGKTGRQYQVLCTVLLSNGDTLARPLTITSFNG